MIKLPYAGDLWSTMYYRYDFKPKACTFLVLGTHADRIESTLQQAFRSVPLADSETDPFVVLANVIGEISLILEEERYDRDCQVQWAEAKTGVSFLKLHPSLKADSFDTNSTQDLHNVAGGLRAFERVIDFQTGCIEYLIQQHKRMTRLRKIAMRYLQQDSASLDNAVEQTRRSLDLSLTFSQNRHKQILVLINRIMTQVKVVDNLIVRQDSRATIVLAEQSRQIAIDTKKDSVAMKTIAALTMLFLPGTFVGVSLLESAYSFLNG